MTTLCDPRIKEFGALVNQGIGAFHRAGALLIDLSKDNPQAHAEIIERNPHLTFEILEAFERIGRRELYPLLLVDGSAGCRRLAGLPYAEQEKLYHSEVSVVVKRSSGLETVRKRVSKLSPQEADRVFDVSRIRPVAEQMKLLRPVHREICCASVQAQPSAPVVVSPVVEAALDEDPKAELARQLSIAQTALLEARTALAMIRPQSRHDDLITRGLTSVGLLRRALSEDEI